jgi:hypothetical protein
MEAVFGGERYDLGGQSPVRPPPASAEALELTPPSRSVRVLDDRGQPVAGVPVVLEKRAGGRVSYRQELGRTGEDGGAALRWSPCGLEEGEQLALAADASGLAGYEAGERASWRLGGPHSTGGARLELSRATVSRALRVSGPGAEQARIAVEVLDGRRRSRQTLSGGDTLSLPFDAEVVELSVAGGGRYEIREVRLGDAAAAAPLRWPVGEEALHIELFDACAPEPWRVPVIAPLSCSGEALAPSQVEVAWPSGLVETLPVVDGALALSKEPARCERGGQPAFTVTEDPGRYRSAAGIALDGEGRLDLAARAWEPAAHVVLDLSTPMEGPFPALRDSLLGALERPGEPAQPYSRVQLSTGAQNELETLLEVPGDALAGLLEPARERLAGFPVSGKAPNPVVLTEKTWDGEGPRLGHPEAGLPPDRLIYVVADAAEYSPRVFERAQRQLPGATELLVLVASPDGACEASRVEGEASAGPWRFRCVAADRVGPEVVAALSDACTPHGKEER